jgi:hypothetical protein
VLPSLNGPVTEPIPVVPVVPVVPEKTFPAARKETGKSTVKPSGSKEGTAHDAFTNRAANTDDDSDDGDDSVDFARR